MANKIALNIAGFNLIINTQEDEAQVRKLNETLNSDLKQILAQNPSASVTNAALLCALDYLDRFDKATHSANNMRDQIKDYMSDASNSKLQYDEEVRKNSELAAEIDSLRARITRMASEGAAGSAAEQSLRTELESLKNELAGARSQLKEQIEKNSSILSDFGILNNALKNKDSEIANLNDRVSGLNARLADDDRTIFELRSALDSLNAEKDRLAQELADASTRAETAVSPSAPDTEERSAAVAPPETDPSEARPAPASFSFYGADTVEEDITEGSDDDDDEYEDDDEYDDEEDDDDIIEDLEEDEPSAPSVPDPIPSAPKKDYRFFDYEDGAVENQDGEVGVGDGFKTFGQMIAEERRQPGNSYEDANSGKLDDDTLPNLSWIDDID